MIWGLDAVLPEHLEKPSVIPILICATNWEEKKMIFFLKEIFANTEFSIAQYSIRYKSVISTSSRLTLVNAEVMKGNETAMAAS